MSMTVNQQKAIDAHDIPIVLSAAAGSGKTTVLSNHVAKRIQSKEISIEDMLIVTFTNDAASEMKERIQKQGINTDNCQIGTIDSLCSRILKENFQKLSYPVLPANFRIGSSEDLDQIRNESVSSAIDEFYKDNDPAFLILCEVFSKNDDDTGLVDAVKKILSYAETNPNSLAWIKEQTDKEKSNSWEKILLDYSREIVDDILKCYTLCINDAQKYAGFEKVVAILEGEKQKFKNFEPTSYSKAYNDIQNIKFSTLKFPNDTPDDKKALIKECRDKAKDLYTKNLLKNAFAVTEKQFRDDVEYLKPLSVVLFNLAANAVRKETDSKAETGIISFSDVEQYASILLSDDDIANEYRNEFKEILVDEFQDVNNVQDYILTRISNNKQNLFIVGDVKQSIYRFRKANPALFLKYIKYYEGTESNIILQENFRSQKAVIETVNEIFKKIMRETIGEISYDDSQKLNMGLDPLKDGVDRKTEIVIIKKHDENSAPNFVANKIVELINSGYALPKDIAILTRKTSGLTPYIAALENRGISVRTSDEMGFFSQPDIIYAINILKAISNPTRDLEMLGALLSPMFGFCDEDIAKIKLTTSATSLYGSIIEKAKTDKKCQDFIEKFSSLRTKLYTLSPSDFIENVFVNPTPNQSLLVEYAQNHIYAGIPTLDDFLNYLNNLRDQEKDLSTAIKNPSEMEVTASTIHKSKGLEWKVVFVCNTEKSFDYKNHEMKDLVALDEYDGFACKVRDAQKRTQRLTMPMRALRIKAENSALSEEERVLYVALTRAKEKLYIVGTQKEPEKYISKVIPSPRSASCYLDWIMYALKDDKSPYYEIKAEDPTEEAIVKVNKELTIEPNKRLDDTYVYPYQDETIAQTVYSVSEIVHGKSTKNLFDAKPSFVTPKIFGTTRGTLLHEYLEKVDFNSPNQIPAELQGLSVELFFKSDIMDEIKKANKVLREFPLLGKIKVNDKESVLKGVADLVLINDSGIVLVDYKTDSVKDERELIALYQKQLLLYSQMLEKIFQKKVKKRLIYSFHLAKTINIV